MARTLLSFVPKAKPAKVPTVPTHYRTTRLVRVSRPGAAGAGSAAHLEHVAADLQPAPTDLVLVPVSERVRLLALFSPP